MLSECDADTAVETLPWLAAPVTDAAAVMLIETLSTSPVAVGETATVGEAYDESDCSTDAVVVVPDEADGVSEAVEAAEEVLVTAALDVDVGDCDAFVYNMPSSVKFPGAPTNSCALGVFVLRPENHE